MITRVKTRIPVTGALNPAADEKLQDLPNVVRDFGADKTGATDSTAAFAAALTSVDNVFMPPGTYLANIDFDGLRGKSLIGAGRDVVTLKNYTNAPVITLDNTGGDCKFNRFADFRILNRDKAVYTTADGIYLTGNALNENDFHTFERLEIVGMRHGLHLGNRTVWNTYQDVHAYSSINDGLHVETTENISQQTFITCRFGTNGSYGMQVDKAAGDLFSGWSFITCTFEKNNLNGVRIAGAGSGIQGWTFINPYFEENTKTLAASSVTPRKANVWIDAAYCVGLDIRTASMYGTPDPTPLDYGIFVEDSCTNCVMEIGPSRWGAFTTNPWRLPATSIFFVGPQLTGGGTPIAPTTGGGRSLSDIPAEAVDTFTATLTGCTTSPTGTVRAVKQGNQVTLYIPAINGTSNTTAATLTGMPSGFFPARTQNQFARVTNSGVNGLGLIQIATSGVITLFSDAAGSAFASSGTKGIADFTVTYSLT